MKIHFRSLLVVTLFLPSLVHAFGTDQTKLKYAKAAIEKVMGPDFKVIESSLALTRAVHQKQVPRQLIALVSKGDLDMQRVSFDVFNKRKGGLYMGWAYLMSRTANFQIWGPLGFLPEWMQAPTSGSFEPSDAELDLSAQIVEGDQKYEIVITSADFKPFFTKDFEMVTKNYRFPFEKTNPNRYFNFRKLQQL